MIFSMGPGVPPNNDMILEVIPECHNSFTESAFKLSQFSFESSHFLNDFWDEERRTLNVG